MKVVAEFKLLVAEQRVADYALAGKWQDGLYQGTNFRKPFDRDSTLKSRHLCRLRVSELGS